MKAKKAEKKLQEINENLVAIWKSSIIRLTYGKLKDLSDSEIGYLIGVNEMAQHILMKSVGEKEVRKLLDWAMTFTPKEGENE